MFGWLYRTIIGYFHMHTWDIIDKQKADVLNIFEYHEDVTTSHVLYILQCKKCGEIKKVRIDA